jgi:phage tail-like protein
VGFRLSLWAWHQTVLKGSGYRKNASLVLHRADGQVVARYNLDKAWPAKPRVTGLKAGSSELLYETVDLVAERIQRVGPQ